jgi:predicted ester cyclase
VTEADLAAVYRRYNATCNAHAFDRLGEFVSDELAVNGEQQTLAGYVAGLEAVVRAFPDYTWRLHRLLVDPPWLSAHFFDSGTHRGHLARHGGHRAAGGHAGVRPLPVG